MQEIAQQQHPTTTEMLRIVFLALQATHTLTCIPTYAKAVVAWTTILVRDNAKVTVRLVWTLLSSVSSWISFDCLEFCLYYHINWIYLLYTTYSI